MKFTVVALISIVFSVTFSNKVSDDMWVIIFIAFCVSYTLTVLLGKLALWSEERKS